jgi:hypothetical protein
MVTVYYLFYCFLGVVGASLLGLATHYWHANFQAYPDKILDGKGLVDTALNELMSPQHSLIGQYDDDGYWEFHSWRNYAIHTTPFVLTVILTGILNWSDQAGTVALICSGFGRIGLTPLTC